MNELTISNELEKTAKELQTLLASLPLKVKDDAHYEEVSNELGAVKRRVKVLDQREKDITAPLNASLRSVRELFGRPKALLNECKAHLDGIMGQYISEQRRKAAAEQAKLDATAEAERRHKAELAARAEKRGNDALAEKHREAAAEIIAPTVLAQRPVASSSSIRKTTTFEVVDEKLIPREYLTPDLVKINRAVQSTKMSTSIPGIRVFEKESIVSR